MGWGCANDFTIDGTANNLRRFLDDDEGDDVEGSADVNSFASPYGFVGFNPDCVPPDVLLSS